MEPIEFAKYWTSLLDSELHFYDNFFKDTPVSAVWRNSLRKRLTYEAAVSLVQFSFRGRKGYRNVLSDPAYRQYLAAIPFDDADALPSGYYVHFLRELPYNMWACKSDEKYFDSITRKYNEQNQYRLRDSIAKIYLKGNTYDLALYTILWEEVKMMNHFKGTDAFESMYKKTDSSINQLGTAFNDKSYLSRIKMKLSALKEENKPAPDFAAYTLDGKPAKLSDYKGKVVYVDFWSTSCAPCVAELPYIKKLQEAYKDNKDIVFLYVSFDHTKEILDHFIKERTFTGTHLVDSKGFSSDAALKYNIASIPRHILVDKAGNLVSADAPRPSAHPEDMLNAALAK
jgi:thiol-disulfide isomerase/thioredoxin